MELAHELQDRVRLLVRDPGSLFVFWDVAPDSLDALGAQAGERAGALAQLTLRLSDDAGAERRVLLRREERARYVPVTAPGRRITAELGLTLPSGSFHPLARSNAVVAPPRGPAASGAPPRVRYPLGLRDAARVYGAIRRPARTKRRPLSRRPAPPPAEPADAAALPGASDAFRR